MTRIAVLASGSGTNLQAILDAAASSDFPAEIVLVISDKPGCKAIERAIDAGVAAEVIEWSDHDGDRASFTREIVDRLRSGEVDLVVLAGFMRILSDDATDAYPNAIINTHPSLLPSFRGAHAIDDALSAGVKVAGVTIHVVSPEVDAGPIIAQEAVPVYSTDDAAALQDRIKAVEHRLFPEVIADWARGRYSVVNGRVVAERAVEERI